MLTERIVTPAYIPTRTTLSDAPSLLEDMIPILCERCGLHEVSTPSEICQPCRVEMDDWNWQAWIEAIYAGNGR